MYIIPSMYWGLTCADLIACFFRFLLVYVTVVSSSKLCSWHIEKGGSDFWASDSLIKYFPLE